VADYLHAVRDPYNVNAAALVAARESLRTPPRSRARWRSSSQRGKGSTASC